MEIQLILVNMDLSQKTVRTQVYGLMDRIENLTKTEGQVENWLEPFTQYLTDEKGKNIDDITDSTEFYGYLKDFEEDSDFDHWDEELVFDDDDNPTEIVATKFYFEGEEPKDEIASYESYESYNELIRDELGQDTECFIFTNGWVYSYFDYALRSYTFQNLLISSLAVLIILILLMDIRLAFFIMCVILLIDVCIFGWMYMVGIDLQTISFCQLCMAVGLTVDYVIHMVHAIAEMKLDPNNNGYDRRIKFAMIETGGSVIKGAVTTFVGASVLAFAGSVAFRSFFYMLAGIIIVAVLFGLIFAPAVMGLMPFIYSGLDKLHAEVDHNGHNVLEYEEVAMTTATDIDDDEYADAI